MTYQLGTKAQCEKIAQFLEYHAPAIQSGSLHLQDRSEQLVGWNVRSNWPCKATRFVVALHEHIKGLQPHECEDLPKWGVVIYGRYDGLATEKCAGFWWVERASLPTLYYMADVEGV